MDFRELFIAYKIALKEDKIIKSFLFKDKMPPYRIKLVCGLLGFMSFYCASFFTERVSWVFLTIFLLVLFLYARWQLNTTANLRDLKARYEANDKTRMEIVISVLDSFKVDWKNMQVMDLLISEANAEKKKCYILEIFVKYRVIFVALLTIWLEVLLNNSNRIDIFDIRYIFIFSLYAIVTYIIWTNLVELCILIFMPDYFTYDEFSHDIRQLMIFGNNYACEQSE